MTTISGVSKRALFHSILAAKKAVGTPIRYAQALQDERDRVAKRVTPRPGVG